MKKAGLCVRYDCDNFGSMLQILATQKAIRAIGWDYEIIRYDKRTPLFYISNVTRLFNPYFMKGKIETFEKNRKLKGFPEVQKENSIRNKWIADYRRAYIGPYSPVYKGYANLVKGAEEYDAMVVGSDQLWTPAGIKSKFYNLLFAPDYLKKVSFATSFGVGEIPASQKKMTTQYLQRIEHISVRETRGAEIVKELTGRDATVALDPTLLYTRDEWREIFPEKRIIDEPYIFAYFLGSNEEHREAVEQLKKESGLKVVTIPFMDVFVERDLTFGDQRLFEVGPIEFLNLIRGAEYICTDSFHGSVFSILNHKQFMTFDRTNSSDKQTRNSRIDSLFGLLGLEKRRYRSGVTLKNVIDQSIDFDTVDQKLAELRQETVGFLNNALNAKE
ncbi:polysaccharide pyruvyl transferase family protein [Oribacterium sp. NK2B42]|uniref:polysaccharide pyruvyl transferase family protein n=1 Tax=Oribacterium sp. NK2B42 TaxID=689781 RepID=UPI0004282148|nr:polysaccharide pyruvyl transferase family protein [Oribacterium sp. NK2B42]